MATKGYLDSTLQQVAAAWTLSSTELLSERVAELMERVLDLWEQLVANMPDGANVANTNYLWSSFLDVSALEADTDSAALRWERLTEVVHGQGSPDDESVLPHLDALVGIGQSACRNLVSAYSGLPEDARLPFQTNRLNLLRVLDDLKTESARVSAFRAAAEVESVRDSTRAAAGEIASGDLAQHFETYRASERKQAEIIRAIAAVIFIVTVVLLALIVPGDRTTAEVFQRAAFSVPLFAVAAYLAAESARHRKASQWAATMRVQLLSVDLFTKPMDPAEAATVRMVLAKRAFGDVPMLGTGAQDKEEAAMPMSLQAVLERLLVELRSKPDK